MDETAMRGVRAMMCGAHALTSACPLAKWGRGRALCIPPRSRRKSRECAVRGVLRMVHSCVGQTHAPMHPPWRSQTARQGDQCARRRHPILLLIVATATSPLTLKFKAPVTLLTSPSTRSCGRSCGTCKSLQSKGMFNAHAPSSTWIEGARHQGITRPDHIETRDLDG